MISGVDFQTVDVVVFSLANLLNLLLVGIFLCRPLDLHRVERVLGLISVALTVPVCLAILLNFLGGREWWTVVLPFILVVFLVMELVLDYILKLNFRQTRLLWPYLLIYYLALIGMVGYSFGVGKVYGFITLGTYFLTLLATWVSYTKVGHGLARH